ncbi:MAG: hypothetical protein WBL63_13375 [Candidatus Acidiferrum sp.]
MKKTSTVRVNRNTIFKGHKLTLGLRVVGHTGEKDLAIQLDVTAQALVNSETTSIIGQMVQLQFF